LSKFKDITVKIAACVLIMLCFLIPGSFFSEPVALLVGAVLAACYVTVLYFMNGVLMGVRVHDFGVEFNKRKGKSRVPKKPRKRRK